MGLFDNFSPNLPLLKGSLGLLAAGERGDSTGLALGQGLLGYAQTRADIKAADALKADKALERQINQARLAQIQAQTGQLINPPPGQRKTIQGADGFNYYLDTGERVLPNVQKAIDPTSAQNDYLLAQKQGFKGSFLDYQTALANAKRTQINNNVNTAPPYKIPENFMLADPNDPSKGVVPIPGSRGGQFSGEGAKLEEISRGGADAVSQLQERMRSGNIDQATLAAASIVPSMFQSSNVQQFETLRTDLTDMIGRLRSGGAITQDEEPRFRALVPKFGDKPETINFKLKQLSDKFNNINTKVQLAPIPGESSATPRSTGNETLEELEKLYSDQ